jgi:hypothetical protein
MRRFFRFALLGYSWLFVTAIVVQVYFAGLMLFGQEGGEGLHETTGYILGTAGALFLLLPALARAGVSAIVVGVVLALIAFFQPNLTFARDDSPFIAALHPVNALLIVGLSVWMVRRAALLVRGERAGAGGTPGSATA